MIKTLLKRAYRQFGSRYDYDTGYMSAITDTSTSAGLRLSVLPLYSQFKGPKDARDVWAGALLGSTLEGDCGPCVQLVVNMALEAEVPASDLALCLKGEAKDAGNTGLGFRFAEAAICEQMELEDLRNEIERRFGAAAVISASFAASAGRVYPVLKRGLGFGEACSKVSVGGDQIVVAHQK